MNFKPQTDKTVESELERLTNKVKRFKGSGEDSSSSEEEMY